MAKPVDSVDSGGTAADRVRSEPPTLDAAREELRKAGYNVVKAGAINTPNCDRVETWMGRAGVVYLTWNAFGWDILASLFGRNPSTSTTVGPLLEKLNGN